MNCKYVKRKYCPTKCMNNGTPYYFECDCYLMGEKELGVLSTSTTKDGVSHSVRDSHASDLEVTKEVRSNGSLEKITNTENKCPRCGEKSVEEFEPCCSLVCCLV